MKKLESTLLNMTLVLTSVSLVAAALLGFMYNITKEPIAIIEQQNLENGIKKVMLGGADAVEKISVEEKTDGDFTIYHTNNANGEYLGAAVKTAVQGFSPKMTVLVGFDPDGNILGYDILKHSETPGLGAKVNTWFQQGGKGDIIGKNPSKNNLTVVKSGGEIDAITASTITSVAFLKAVNLEYEKLFSVANGNTGATDLPQTAEPENEVSLSPDSVSVEMQSETQNVETE